MKKDIVALIAKDVGRPQGEVKKVLDRYIDSVLLSLRKGEKVTIKGFGTFSVGKRQARIGRNPQTGKAIKIADARIATFKPGIALKRAVKK